MKSYSLKHVPDAALLHGLSELVARDRVTTAELLAHLAEVEARKLHLVAGYSSLYEYCVRKIGLGEQAAFKRIRVARAAREYPLILEAIAQGRLCLSAVILLIPHLSRESAESLLSGAAHKTRFELETMLAARFPQPDVSSFVRAFAPPPPPANAANGLQLSPGTVDSCAAERMVRPNPAPVAPSAPFPRVTPLAPQRYALQFTVGQETHDLLRQAQDLLGHRVPSGDLAQVFDRALKALVSQLEKRKFGTTDKPRRTTLASKSARHIPNVVRRRVWRRDDGRCTFVGSSGERCEERRGLEFDHWKEAARRGEATVANIRLRCRAHNQYAAEQTYGTEYMRAKREQAAARQR